jgi:hypothetical protein
LDIFEASRLREWSKGRTFLLDIDVAHLQLKDFAPGSKLRLFKWDFELTQPHPDTDRFLRSQEHQVESSALQLFDDALDPLYN